MEDCNFKEEDLHLDLRPRRKRRFRNNKPTKKVTNYVSTDQTFRVYFLTWNTNSRAAPDRLWALFPHGYDIYAIGLQEVGSDWLTYLDPVFHSYDVVRIKARRLQGIQTVVYVRRSLLPHLCSIESETTKTGLGGIWGNKGSVSVRFELFGINLIVVNCHLAAHMEKVAERLQDIDTILDNQRFKDKNVNNILDHDYVFWLGDLNFRIEDIPYEAVLQHIGKKNYDQILLKDQLKSVMEEQLAFPGFKESEITFAPTYKFDVGSDTYDSSAKKRVPAYCDRILYFHHDTSYSKKDNLYIEVSEYRSHPSFMDSDHKPVSCSLEFAGLHDPPLNPVVFIRVKKAANLKQSFVVKFHCRTIKQAFGDWIGLYKTDFMHFDQYIGYQWVPGQSVFSSPSVTFSTATLKKLGNAKTFLACYISKQYHFCGISEPYDLVHH